MLVFMICTISIFKRQTNQVLIEVLFSRVYYGYIDTSHIAMSLADLLKMVIFFQVCILSCTFLKITFNEFTCRNIS